MALTEHRARLEERQMTFYQRQGMLPPRRYTVLERASGGYYHEELMSSEGFSGASSTLYRLNAPTRIRHVRDGGATQPKFYDGVPDNMLFRADQVISSGDCRTARVPLFGNDDVLYSVSRPTAIRCSPPVGLPSVRWSLTPMPATPAPTRPRRTT